MQVQIFIPDLIMEIITFFYIILMHTNVLTDYNFQLRHVLYVKSVREHISLLRVKYQWTLLLLFRYQRPKTIGVALCSGNVHIQRRISNCQFNFAVCSYFAEFL